MLDTLNLVAYTLPMMKMVMVTDLKTRMTFILEIRRRQGPGVVYASVMPATHGGDVRIALSKVPLYIRRAAKTVFTKASNAA